MFHKHFLLLKKWVSGFTRFWFWNYVQDPRVLLVCKGFFYRSFKTTNRWLNFLNKYLFYDYERGLEWERKLFYFHICFYSRRNKAESINLPLFNPISLLSEPNLPTWHFVKFTMLYVKPGLLLYNLFYYIPHYSNLNLHFLIGSLFWRKYECHPIKSETDFKI